MPRIVSPSPSEQIDIAEIEIERVPDNPSKRPKLDNQYDVRRSKGGLYVARIKPLIIAKRPLPTNDTENNPQRPLDGVQYNLNTERFFKEALEYETLPPGEKLLFALLMNPEKGQLEADPSQFFEPKPIRKPFYNRNTHETETVLVNSPSDYESLCIKMLDAMNKIVEIPDTIKGPTKELTMLYELGKNYLRHGNPTLGYELPGGRLLTHALELLKSTNLRSEGRDALYNLIDIFEISDDQLIDFLQEMSKKEDLQHPLATRLLLKTLTSGRELKTEEKHFIDEQRERATLIKSIYDNLTLDERMEPSKVTSLISLGNGIILDIDSLESYFGKKVGIEVEYLSQTRDPKLPKGFNGNLIEERAQEIRLNENQITFSWAHLATIDELRRFLTIRSTGEINTAHMHFDRYDFAKPNLMGLEHVRNSTIGTYEVRRAFPISAAKNALPSTRTFANYFLLLAGSGVIQDIETVNTGPQSETDKHVLWAFLNKFSYLKEPSNIIPALYFSEGNREVNVLGLEKDWSEYMQILLSNNFFELIESKLTDESWIVRQQAVSAMRKASEIMASVDIN